MYATSFDYYRATSVAEAVELLQKHAGAKLLAGGHSLLPTMKLRVAQPPALIDIGRLEELRELEMLGEQLRLGALVTHSMLAASALVREHCPLLAETAGRIGDQQVRNRGTLGGSLAHADPAADYPTAILALEAMLGTVGAEGGRTVPAAEFFTDLLTTALTPDEVLVHVTVPSYGTIPGMGGAYLKHPHPASGYAVVGVAALVHLQDGKFAKVSIAIGGATATPIRAEEAEAALTGQVLSAENIAAAAEQVGLSIHNPLSDAYASEAYRVQLAKVLTQRALTQAVARAQGK